VRRPSGLKQAFQVLGVQGGSLVGVRQGNMREALAAGVGGEGGGGLLPVLLHHASIPLTVLPSLLSLKRQKETATVREADSGRV